MRQSQFGENGTDKGPAGYGGNRRTQTPDLKENWGGTRKTWYFRHELIGVDEGERGERAPAGAGWGGC